MTLEMWNEFESGRAPVWSESGGGRAPPLVGSKSTISRFSGRFRDDQYSFVSFLFVVLLLTVPPCPAICKSGEAGAPRATWSGATIVTTPSVRSASI